MAGSSIFSVNFTTSKNSSVTKHGFVIWAQCKPTTRLEICRAFQDRLTCLNRHIIGCRNNSKLNCAIIYHYVLRLKNVSYCVLCCILYWLLLDDQESANERYRSTVKDLLSPHTVSQKDKKLNTAVLDDTIVPHIKIKITEIQLEKKLSTALNTVNPNVPLVNWIKSNLLRLTPISSQGWKMIKCFYCGFIKGLPFIMQGIRKRCLFDLVLY